MIGLDSPSWHSGTRPEDNRIIIKVSNRERTCSKHHHENLMMNQASILLFDLYIHTNAHKYLYIQTYASLVAVL